MVSIMNIGEKFSLFLKNECLRQNISTAELKDRSGISITQINALKNNQVKDPRYTTIQLLVEALGYTWKEFLETIGEIEIFNNYVVDAVIANEIINANLHYLELCKVDVSKLSEIQKIEIADYIIRTFKLISNKYI